MKSGYKIVFKKALLLSLMIVGFTMLGFGATYYISNAGNDSNSGLSEALAWKTLAKVNTTTFVAGDQILFKRGDAWEGTLTVTASGTSGNPIVYGAYGTGENPKIYGSTGITGWTQHSGNIYKAKVSQPITQLFIDGERMMLARYPNTGWFDITSVQSATTFTSTGLNSGMNYSGAQCMIRSTAYYLYSKTVTVSSSQTITINEVPFNGLGVGKGIVMCNKLEFLDSPGEWYYDSFSSTVYLFTPNGDSPVNYEVRGTLSDYGIHIISKTNISIENLEILNTGKIGIYAYGSTHNLKVNNTTVSFPGMHGIRLDAASPTGVALTNNSINGAIESGITAYAAKILISDNVISNITKFESLGFTTPTSITGSAGIRVRGDGNGPTITYNRITDVGYNGIYFYGTNSGIKYNYINGACQVFDDGAGIYTYCGSDYSKPASAGSEIMYNIILNVYGNKNGYPQENDRGAGIYMDDGIRDVLIENNTVSGTNHGVFSHNNSNLTVNANTIMDAMMHVLVVGAYGSSSFTNNIIYATGRIGSLTWWQNTFQRLALRVTSSVFNYNKYVHHYQSEDIFQSGYNFSEWNAATGQDVQSTFDNSALSPGETEKLFYNDTKQDKAFDLGSTTYRDIDGNSVTGKLTLKPYTGKILIGTKFDSTPNDTENPEITTFTVPATSTSLIVSLSSLSATDNIGVTGYLIAESSTKPLATDPGWSSTKPTTYVFTSVGSKTLYAWAKDAAGNVSLSRQATTVISAPVATSFSFTGPSSGNINSASTNFNVTPNNPFTGTITITPSGTGSAGLSPKVLSFSNSSTAQTFTITPSVTGSITLMPTNNGTLTNPANLTYTVNAVVPDAPTSVVATSGEASASVTFIAPTNTGGSAITGYTVTSIPAGGTDINAGSTSLNHTITGLTDGTSYMFTVKATNSVGSSLASVASNSIENIIIKQGEIIPSHFITVWNGLNGLNHMNINVVSAVLEDLSLSADDEIAVFSGSACVGASKLTQSIIPSDNTTFVTILASQNDGSVNGFIDNDTIVFKIWNNKAQKELEVNGVVYRNDISTWKTNGRYSPGATTVVEIASYQVYTQSIELLKGYNMISTYVSAQNPNASVVTKTLVDQGNLIKMQDETGNSFENWGDFGGWINKLGSLEKTEGYKIQVANNCTLQVTGRRIAMPLDINLKAGWNIISFPRTDMVDAMGVVQTLIDQNKLVKVQDETGNSIENWGIYGGWKNSIGNFIPDKAYKVKMNVDAVLTFQESYTKSAVVLAKSEETEYFSSSIEGNGTDHMNINITGLNSIGIAVGDELAAFDGEVCVGTTKITEANLLTGSVCLVTSFSTDDQNSNGFKVGNPIQISSWSKLSGDESKVITEVITGQMKYEKNASVLVKMKSATIATAINNLNAAVKIDVFPNPCQGMVTVRFSEIPEANSRIEISDISGRKLISRHISGTSEEFNLEFFTPGLYLVKSILGSSEFVQKLIVNK